MLPANILKERDREANRRTTGDLPRDRMEDNKKRKRKALEQQRELLEQGILRCPRHAGLGAGAGARRARVHRRVPRSLPRTQVRRRCRWAHGKAARAGEHRRADAQAAVRLQALRLAVQ